MHVQNLKKITMKLKVYRFKINEKKKNTGKIKALLFARRIEPINSMKLQWYSRETFCSLSFSLNAHVLSKNYY